MHGQPHGRKSAYEGRYTHVRVQAPCETRANRPYLYIDTEIAGGRSQYCQNDPRKYGRTDAGLLLRDTLALAGRSHADDVRTTGAHNGAREGPDCRGLAHKFGVDCRAGLELSIGSPNRSHLTFRDDR